MDTWRGEWTFKNAQHDRNGRSGTATVQAPTATRAEEAIKDYASQELFGTTIMQFYVTVTRLTKLPQHPS